MRNVTSSLIYLHICTDDLLTIKTRPFCFILVGGKPSRKSLEVHSKSSTSLLVRWAPPADDAVVSGYMIKLTDKNGETLLFNVSGQITELLVNELYRYSKYCVTLRVINGSHLGNESDEVCAFTAIDGK